MSRSVSVASRSAGIILVMTLALALGPARSSHAMGCHMPDRPTLGLPALAGGIEAYASFTPSGEVTASLERDVQVVPRPCTGEVPSPTSQSVASPAQALTMAAQVSGAEPRRERMAAERAPVWPQVYVFRLDRPPRPIASGVTF